MCIYRLPRGESVIGPRSRCPKCGTILGARDLVPVLSYALARGRCRYCGEKLSVFYPAIEVGTGALFLLVVLRHGITPRTLGHLALASMVAVAAGIDLGHGVIPDRLTLPGMAVGVVTGAFGGASELVSRVAGLVACGGLVLVVAALSRGGMGGGDVKLMAVVGSFLGPWGGLASFMMACLSGAAVGLVLVALGRKSRKDEVPFAPFIALGTMVVCISGDWAVRLAFPWLGSAPP